MFPLLRSVVIVAFVAVNGWLLTQSIMYPHSHSKLDCHTSRQTRYQLSDHRDTWIITRSSTHYEMRGDEEANRSSAFPIEIISRSIYNRTTKQAICKLITPEMKTCCHLGSLANSFMCQSSSLKSKLASVVKRKNVNKNQVVLIFV